MKKYKWNRVSIIASIILLVVLTVGCITIETTGPSKQPSSSPDDKATAPPAASHNKDLPAIMSFAVNPVEVSPGEEATLSWDVANANTIIIEPEIGDVSASGSLIVTPKESTIYTLTASNASGEPYPEVSSAT